MSDSIIEVKNISKRYVIGHERSPYHSLRDDLVGFFKKPTRWLRGHREVREPFWALKDINFEVKRGEVLGIIGANGAGKSTLLKILSRITYPTTGEIRMQGRVGSLLEVGTGFHPELTGRENIYLNGAILGMARNEIKRKFDEIVDFAGIEKFLDTPVKHYSSGMYVRLAFSVAAHLEPDTLIIDEVLAVGDAEFQKKCLGKMNEITRKEGRTILFVSHNMSAIRNLCTKTIWLENSKIKAFGDTGVIVDKYIYGVESLDEMCTKIIPNYTKEITFTKIWITDNLGIVSNNINDDQEFTIWLEFEVTRPIHTAEISIVLKNTSGINVTFTSLSDSFGRKFVSFEKGKYITSTKIRKNFLMPDVYMIRISAHERGFRDIDAYENVARLNIIENNSPMAAYGSAAHYWSTVLSDAGWGINENERINNN